MSESESERLCIGGPYDGQWFMLPDGHPAWPFMNGEEKVVWYRSDSDDPTRAIYAGPEFDGMDEEEFRSAETLAEEMAPWLEEQEHDGE